MFYLWLYRFGDRCNVLDFLSYGGQFMLMPLEIPPHKPSDIKCQSPHKKGFKQNPHVTFTIFSFVGVISVPLVRRSMSVKVIIHFPAVFINI